MIVPEIEAIATDALAEIEAAGLSEVIPTAQATQLTMNREGIRRLAAERLGLRTSGYAFADSMAAAREAADRLGYPCIIKPVMSSSGKGQSTVQDSAGLEAAWDYAMRAGRVNRGRVIIEERILFDYEITLLTVRARNPDGKIGTHFCAPIGHRQEHGDYVESWQPQPMPADALGQARQIAERITTELGGRGLFGVELFIRGNDVLFSEVSPRPHDTGMVTMITQQQNEFELHARAILGLPVDTRLAHTGASAVIYGGLDAEGIAFEGLERALATDGTDLRLFGKPVSYLRRRMGVALAQAAETDSARQKAAEVAAGVVTVSPG